MSEEIYTRDSNDIFFLNDKNVVSSWNDNGPKGINPIPSKAFFKEVYNELSDEDKGLQEQIDQTNTDVSLISGRVDTLCSEIYQHIEDVSDALSSEISSLSNVVDVRFDALLCSDTERANRFVTAVSQEKGLITVTRRILTEDDIPQLSTNKIVNFTPAVSSEFRGFGYDINSHTISIDIAGNQLCVDATDFLRNRVVTHVNICGPDDNKILVIWFTLKGQETGWLPIKPADEGTDYITIGIKELTQVYKFSNGLSSDGFLNVGATDELVRWNEISTYTRNLKFNGHITNKYIDDITESDSVSAFFTRWCVGGNQIYNGSFITVEFSDDNIKASTTSKDFTVGKGDVVVIHDHSTKNIIDSSELSCPGNVYILKGGVSKYEFEDLQRQVISNDNDISALSDSVNKSFQFLNRQLDVLSVEMSSRDDKLSTEIDNLSTGLSVEIDNLSNALSTEIDNVVKVGIGEDESVLSNSQLSVWKLSRDKYEQLLVDGEINDNCLYVISSDYFDAYGRVLSNVAMEDSSTKNSYLGVAATKPYVNKVSADLIESRRDVLSGKIDDPDYQCFKIMKNLGVSADLSTAISAIYKVLDFFGAFH